MCDRHSHNVLYRSVDTTCRIHTWHQNLTTTHVTHIPLLAHLSLAFNALVSSTTCMSDSALVSVHHVVSLIVSVSMCVCAFARACARACPPCRTNAAGVPVVGPSNIPWKSYLFLMIVSAKLLADTETMLQVRSRATAEQGRGCVCGR